MRLCQQKYKACVIIYIFSKYYELNILNSKTFDIDLLIIDIIK